MKFLKLFFILLPLFVQRFLPFIHKILSLNLSKCLPKIGGGDEEKKSLCREVLKIEIRN